MIPNLNIFGKEISYYMLAALVGIFAVLIYTQLTAKRRGVDEIEVLYTTLWSFLGVVLGGHLLYGAVNYQYFVSFLNHLNDIHSITDFFQALTPVFGGSVFYGGLFGSLAAIFIYLRHKGLPYGEYTDITAPAIAFFHIFGRIGCFLGGCCYGIESSVGWVYHYSIIETANGVTRFPVQLLEAAGNLLIFLLLHSFLKKGKMKGHLLSLYLMLYAPMRFAIEFLRGDEYRGFIGVLSVSQFISAVVMVVIIIRLVFIRSRKKLQPEK